MHIDSQTYQSQNYNSRPSHMAIDSLVIHTTEGSWDSDAEWMCNPTSQVSTHYVISPAGGVYQLVHPNKRAWHAGDSFYVGRDNWNDFSIGIEISHYAGQQYPKPQVETLHDLTKTLIAQFHIPQELIVKHKWIATNPPGRKSDPSDWSDSDFQFWVTSLYAGTVPTDPLTARQIAGADRMYYCGVGFYDAYYKNNGLWWAGYPRSDEIPYLDSANHESTYMAFERLYLKYNAIEGVRTALLSEAIQQGWI